MNVGIILSAIVSLLEKLADLLIAWRTSKGSQVVGVGSAMDRFAAIVDKWAATDFPGMTKDQANAERRSAVLNEARQVGFDLSEKYLRWMIESVLIRKEAGSDE